MPKSRSKSKRRRASAAPSPSSDARLARTLAPEELRAGDVIAVLAEITEWPSWFWNCDATILPPHEPVRIAKIPDGAGTPLTIEAVCLPFVLVKSPCGLHRTLDVRRCRLARVDAGYAAAVRRAVRKRKRGAKGE